MGLLQASFFEWVYHRYWLHRPWLPPQMFTAHTLVHHQLCKNEDTFHVVEEEQEEALTFQWWGGVVLISVNLLPWIGLAWLLSARGVQWPYVPLVATIGATTFVYYVAYEGLHYLMHKPTYDWIENSAAFRFIKRHHQLHHIYMGSNFNVVLPVADMIMGTLVLRDPKPTRPTGPGARKVARRHSRYGETLRAQGLDEADAAAPARDEIGERATPEEVNR